MPQSLKEASTFVDNGFSVIGRTDAIRSIYSALSRSKSNNCILIGRGGIGTTSLLQSLHTLKSAPETPALMMSKVYQWLDCERLFSFQSQDEIYNDFRKTSDILKSSSNNILVIDNISAFIDGCVNSGSTSVLNKFINDVEGGAYQCIIECDYKDYHKFLGLHNNIKDYFTIVDINELTGDDLKHTINHAVERLHQHHHVNIDSDVAEMALFLTTKFNSTFFSLDIAQPQSTVNLIDIALSYFVQDCNSQIDPDSVNVIKSYTDTIANLNGNKTKFEEELTAETRKLEERREQDGKLNRDQSEREFELIDIMTAVNKDLDEYQSKLKDVLSEIYSKFTLTSDYTLKVFSEKSQIPLDRLTQDEQQKLLKLESNLNGKIFDQTQAVSALANAVITSSVGLSNENKPQAAFMFCGPSGTGKTECVKQLAYLLRGSEKDMIRFDMSEYMEKHAVAKLIGAPPGYEGYENGGILTNAVKANGHSIILFDEVEKAHISIFDVLLQVLDDGRLTDNRGITIDFTNTIIVLTTNIGQPLFFDESLSESDVEVRLMEEMEEVFRPEFLNRLNGRENIIPFYKLSVDTIVKIARRELEKLNNNVSKKTQSTVSMSDGDLYNFCSANYDAKRGARMIEGYFVSRIYPEIAKKILSSTIESELQLVYNGDNNSIQIYSSDDLASKVA